MGEPLAEPAAALDDIRAWADDPSAVIYAVPSKHGYIALLPADVVGKTNDQLLAFIRQRCLE